MVRKYITLTCTGLADPEELEFIGGRDYFSDGGLCLVEWPSKGHGELPVADLEITFDYNLPGRKATIVAGTESGERMLESMKEQQGDGCRRHQG